MVEVMLRFLMLDQLQINMNVLILGKLISLPILERRHVRSPGAFAEETYPNSRRLEKTLLSISLSLSLYLISLLPRRTTEI